MVRFLRYLVGNIEMFGSDLVLDVDFWFGVFFCCLFDFWMFMK